MTARTETSPTTRSMGRTALRWLPTFFGFPLGGLVAELVVGPVDALAAALIGGLISGIILGAVQSWGLGPAGPATRQWIIATAVGFTIGLGIGAAAVDYGTSIGELAVQGAICGVAIGVAQAAVLRPRLGALAFAWAPVLGGLWALGWTITTSIGVDVESQYTVFGSSGAWVTVLTVVLPLLLARRLEPEGIMTRHVVFGTGQVGRHVVTQLVEDGHDVFAVNRSGRGDFAGAHVVGGDVTDEVFAKEVTSEASTVYFCLNASNYHRWPEEFPPLQDAVLAAARDAGARLVVLENLYAYGPTGGAPMTEATPSRSENAKGATRAAMSQQLLDADARGDVEVVIGRAADLVGPGVTASSMAELVFLPALAGKRAKTMGRPGTLHTYSYAPDVGRNLVLLGSRDDAYGRAWHLPNPETLTTREVITKVFTAAGTKPRITALKRPLMQAIGLVNRDVRELLATYYQFDAPFIVDDTAFTAAFGGTITGWEKIVEQTLVFYRTR